MERIGACVAMREPVLLVGETGIGKTRVIDHLARELGQTLVVQVSFPVRHSYCCFLLVIVSLVLFFFINRAEPAFEKCLTSVSVFAEFESAERHCGFVWRIPADGCAPDCTAAAR